MAFSVFAEQKAAVSHIDEQLLAKCVSGIELILADKKIAPEESKNKVFEQLKLVQGALEEHVRTDESYSALLSKINAALARTEIPDNINEIIISLNLAIYALKLEKILNGDIVDNTKTTSQLIHSQLKDAEKYLKEIGRTDRKFDGLKEKITDAHRSLVPGDISFPLNMSEILSELKGEAPPKKKEEEKKKKPDKDKTKENNWVDPLSIDVSKPGESLIYLKQNATYENLEKYTKDFNDKFDQLSSDFIDKALSFLQPYLISFLANEDYLLYAQNPSYAEKTYGDYVSGQSKNNDCYTYANRKIFERYENVYLGENNYLKGTEEKHPISSAKDYDRIGGWASLKNSTFYLQAGDAIGKSKPHWGVVVIENGEVYVVSRGSWKGEDWIHKETLHEFLDGASSIDIIHYHSGSDYGQYVELDGNTKHGEIMGGAMPNNR